MSLDYTALDLRSLLVGEGTAHRGAFWAHGMDGAAGLTIQRPSTTSEHLICIRRNQTRRDATVLAMARRIALDARDAE